MQNIKECVGNENEILAHLSLNKKKETLTEHTKRCQKYWKEMIIQGNYEDVFQNFEAVLCKDMSEESKNIFREMTANIITWHDFGKCNPVFQMEKMNNDNCVQSPRPSNNIGGQHSILSAVFYLDYYVRKINNAYASANELSKTKLIDYAYMYSYLIARHHSDFSDFSQYMDNLLNRDDVIGRDAIKWMENWKLEVWDEKSNFSLRNISENERMQNRICSEGQDFSITLYAWMRLQFSLLTAADYYATSEFINSTQITDFGNLNRKNINTIITEYEKSDIQKKIRNYEGKIYPMSNEKLKEESDINTLRKELFIEAEKKLKDNLDQTIYYLEAPTGSGKSNTAMNLSFQLLKGRPTLRKLFYIYPYNSLVDQNMENIGKVFDNNKNVLNQVAVVNSVTEYKNKHNNEDTNYDEILLDRQFLNYPIVLSTHVTLFKTMFGNKKNDVFGFQQLCHSVIVMDEIQSYKISLWPKMINFLKQFAKIMDMKIIIMSATLPNLDLLAQDQNQTVKLIDNRDKYFCNKLFKNRVKINCYLLIKYNNISLEQLANHVLRKKNRGKKILVEFIKKTSADAFYQIVKDHNNNIPVYSITGDTSIGERRKILHEVSKSKSVILIATQTIEAGVDIDMDIGYKNISMLDSEEQLLGRINRSYKHRGVVYLFYFDNPSDVYKNDPRICANFLVTNIEFLKILINKDFKTYYEDHVLKEVVNTCSDESFFKTAVGFLNFPEVSKKMELIDSTLHKFSVYFGAGDPESENESRNLWNEYKALLKTGKTDEMNYAEKKVKLHDLRVKMNDYIYELNSIDGLPIEEEIGDLYYVSDGDQYFDENGKLCRDVITKNGMFLSTKLGY